MPKRGDLYECAQKVNQQKAFKKRDEHLYSPRMVGEIKEKKNNWNIKQTNSDMT